MGVMRNANGMLRGRANAREKEGESVRVQWPSRLLLPLHCCDEHERGRRGARVSESESECGYEGAPARESKRGTGFRDEGASVSEWESGIEPLNADVGASESEGGRGNEGERGYASQRNFPRASVSVSVSASKSPPHALRGAHRGRK